MRPSLLLRSPAPAVIAMLAVSIGVLTATFGVAWAALYRPPPFPGAERIVTLHTTHEQRVGARDAARAEWRWSFPRASLLRETATTLTHVAPYSPTELSVAGGDETEAIAGEFAAASYFQALGVGAAHGRLFGPAESEPGSGAAVVVIGEALARRRFGGAREAIGSILRINRAPHEVIGVMPPGFRGVSDRAQLWLPISAAPALTYPEYLTTDQDFISVVARLAPGTSVAGATAELETIVPRIYAAFPDADHDLADRPSGVAHALGDSRIRPGTRQSLFLLASAVVLLHLLACANATSLLLGHAFARTREFAVRVSLGCTRRALAAWRWRESALVMAAGGAAGTVIAAWLVKFASPLADMLGRGGQYGAIGSFAAPAFDWATLAVGAALTVVTAAVVALAPWGAAQRADLDGALRGGGRGVSSAGTSLRRPSARGVLVACEMALAMALCTAGALMLESFDRMRNTPLGIDADGVLTFALRPSDARVPPAEAPAYITRMLDAIAAVPGVTSATVDGGAPVSGTARSTLQIVGRPVAGDDEAPPVLRHYVAPDHFRTLGIAVRSGRAFTRDDVAGRPRVAVVSEGAARRFWPGRDPIGERVWFGAGSAFDHPDSSAEIVGVVGDVRYDPLDQSPNIASVYTPYPQFTYGWRIYFVRTAGDPRALIAPIRRAVRGVDPDVPLVEVQSLRDLVGASWQRQRSDAAYHGAFALLALALAVSGIYAVVSRAVGERMREMGIRLALGARPRGIVALVVREGLVFPAIGLVPGIALALALGAVLRASLYGVAPTDPGVLGATVALLLAAAVAACLVPARRAMRADPCEALRAE